MNLIDAFTQLDADGSAHVALRWAGRSADPRGQDVLTVARRVAVGGGAHRDELELLAHLLSPDRQGAVPVWYAAARHIHRRHHSRPGPTYPMSLALAARRDGTCTPTQWADIAEAAGASSRVVAQIAAGLADGWDGSLGGLVDAAELLAGHQPPHHEPPPRQLTTAVRH